MCYLNLQKSQQQRGEGWGEEGIKNTCEWTHPGHRRVHGDGRPCWELARSPVRSYVSQGDSGMPFPTDDAWS